MAALSNLLYSLSTKDPYMLYKESIIIPWHRYPDEVPEHGRPVFFKNPAEPSITEINTVGYERDLSEGSLWTYPDEIITYILPAGDSASYCPLMRGPCPRT